MNIMATGRRLFLRQAEETDLDYIMKTEYASDNLPYIVPFSREKHLRYIAAPTDAMDVIAVEKDSGKRVGYFLVSDLENEMNKIELTHVVIVAKGMGYGHESLKLLKHWAFCERKVHRVYLDCKEYNERALKLYADEGFVREGLLRETILTNGVYENLVVLGILDREYFSRQEQGLEL